MKSSLSILASLAAIVGMSAPDMASAYPNGAGSCKKGPAVLASSSPHLAADKGGTLSDGGYVLSVNGTSLFLEAEGDGNYFKGFLFRLSAKNESAVGAMKRLDGYRPISQLLESTGASVGNPATCSVDVAGICHKDSDEKTKVGVKLKLKEGVEYKMMITVVKAEHEWYFSSRKLRLSGSSIDTVGKTHDSTSLTTQEAADSLTDDNSTTTGDGTDDQSNMTDSSIVEDTLDQGDDTNSTGADDFVGDFNATDDSQQDFGNTSDAGTGISARDPGTSTIAALATEASSVATGAGSMFGIVAYPLLLAAYMFV